MTVRNTVYPRSQGNLLDLGLRRQRPPLLALGYVVEPGYVDPGGASIIDPDGRDAAIGWPRVAEGKPAKNPAAHIDIRVAGEGL